MSGKIGKARISTLLKYFHVKRGRALANGSKYLKETWGVDTKEELYRMLNRDYEIVITENRRIKRNLKSKEGMRKLRQRNEELYKKLKKFKQTRKWFQPVYHLDAQGKLERSKMNITYNVVFSVIVGDARTSKWYKYEIGSSSQAWKNFKVGERLIMNASIFDEDIPIFAGERWADFKKEMIHLGAMNNQFERIDIVTESRERLFQLIQDLKMDDDVTSMELSNLLSSMVILEINSKAYVGKKDTDKFEKRRLRNMAAEKYISNTYTTYKINPDASSWCDLLDDSEMDAYNEELANLPNSCMVKLIISNLKASFDKYYSSLKDAELSKRRLTVASIVQICQDKEWVQGEEVILTVEEAVKWFKAYNLGVEFYNFENILIYKFHPQKFHSHVQPKILRVIYHNEHAEQIHLMKSFLQKCINIDPAPKKELSTQFYIPDTTRKQSDPFMAESSEEILEIIKSESKSLKDESKTTTIIYNNDMKELLVNFLNNGWTPEISTQSGVTINGVVLRGLGKGDKLTIKISPAVNIKGITEYKMNGIEEFKKFVNMDRLISSTLMNKAHVSYMDETDKYIFDNYNTTIAVGRAFGCQINPYDVMLDKFCHIDAVKFYPSCLYNAPYLPMVSIFEKWFKVPSHHVVASDKQYLVQILDQNNPLYNKEISIIYGFELLNLLQHQQHAPKIVILAYRNLITFDMGNVRYALDQLFDGHIDNCLAKFSGVKNIGKTGTKYNKQRSSICFKSEVDANIYLQTNPGKKFKLCENIWIVTSIQQVRLENGFLPIYEMILGMARMRLFNMTLEMQSEGIEIIGYKTDAIFFKKPVAPLQSYKFSKYLTGVFGDWRLEESNKLPPEIDIKFIPCKLDIKFAEKPEPLPIPIEHYLLDEFNEKAVNALIKPHTIGIGGAGCGKSSSIVKYMKNKYKPEEILGVTPWNSQARNLQASYNIKAITYHNLRGEGISGKDHKTPYKLEGIKVIQFDEIMLFTHNQLMKIKKFMENNPDIEFLATGDPYQLEAIGDIIDNKRKQGYVMQLFPHKLTLKINKRIKASDRPRLAAIESDIKSGNYSVEQVVRKHFPASQFVQKLNGMKTKDIYRAVSYFDSSQRTLNKTIHSYKPHNRRMITKVKTLENGITYYFEEYLICKKSFKLQNKKLHPNYVYKIKMMNNKEFTLEDILDGQTVKVSHNAIMNNFSLPYCNTVHSSQGDKIAEKFIIADWKVPMADLNWLYTAITRCTQLDDIYFLEECLKDINMVNTFTEKIRKYKEQDRKAGRDINEEDYLTVDYMISVGINQSWTCPTCGKYMSCEKSAANKFTMDRQNNKLGHTRANCPRALCHVCNSAKADIES